MLHLFLKTGPDWPQSISIDPWLNRIWGIFFLQHENLCLNNDWGFLWCGIFFYTGGSTAFCRWNCCDLSFWPHPLFIMINRFKGRCDHRITKRRLESGRLQQSGKKSLWELMLNPSNRLPKWVLQPKHNRPPFRVDNLLKAWFVPLS